jgi:CRP-like cAMP-binding protein
MFAVQHWAKPKVLIVEDSYLTAAAVGDMVRDCGCEVAGTVGRVESGIEFLCKHTVDVAVVDIDLHGESSLPICQQLKSRDIPFFFLTGYDQRHEIPQEFKGRKLVSKPVDDRELGTALWGIASTGRAPQAGGGNLVLDRLSIAEWSLLRPRLEHVVLKAGEMLETPGQAIRHVYFPMTGLLAVRASSAQGKRIDVGLVGGEGMTGTAALLDPGKDAETETVVLYPGVAWRIAVPALAELLRQNYGLHSHLLRAAHGFMTQMARNMLSAGCGTIEQRLARQLLMISIRIGAKRLALTHDELAKGLAVRRSGVTVALHMLEARNVIRVRRNLVEILETSALVREAGEACWIAADAPSGIDERQPSN